MPTPRLTQTQAEQVIAVLRKLQAEGYRLDGAGAGRSGWGEASRRMGISDGTLRGRVRAARDWYGLTPDADPPLVEAPIEQPLPASPLPVTDATSDLSARIHAHLRKARRLVTIEELSDVFDLSVRRVRSALEDVRQSGYNVLVTDDAAEVPKEVERQTDPMRIDVERFEGKTLRFGLTADNHLCSKYERMDVLNALFDIWQSEGVTTVLQAGNIIDGECRFNQFDVHRRGMDAQVGYLVESWPHRDGINTQFLTGDDHEGWYVQREGVDIGRMIESQARDAGRDDLQHLGYMERNIVLEHDGREQVLRVMHAGGGSAYAISYTSQKIVESLQGGEKPNILIIGHFHKYDVGYPRNVVTIQPGCTQDQSPFMRKRRLEAHVGGATLEVTLGDDGLIHNVTHRWHPFYDRDFYRKAWSYKK